MKKILTVILSVLMLLNASMVNVISAEEGESVEPSFYCIPLCETGQDEYGEITLEPYIIATGGPVHYQDISLRLDTFAYYAFYYGEDPVDINKLSYKGRSLLTPSSDYAYAGGNNVAVITTDFEIGIFEILYEEKNASIEVSVGMVDDQSFYCIPLGGSNPDEFGKSTLSPYEFASGMPVHKNSIDLEINTGAFFAFYYGQEPVDISKLRYKGEPLQSPGNDFYPYNDKNNVADVIVGSQIGTFDITYVDNNETIPVNISLPTLGLYIDPIRDFEHCINNIQGTSGTYYLMWDDEKLILPCFNMDVFSEQTNGSRVALIEGQDYDVDESTLSQSYVKIDFYNLTIETNLFIELWDQNHTQQYINRGFWVSRQMIENSSLNEVKIIYNNQSINLVSNSCGDSQFVWHFDYDDMNADYQNLFNNFEDAFRNNYEQIFFEVKYSLNDIEYTKTKNEVSLLNVCGNHGHYVVVQIDEPEEVNYIQLCNEGGSLDESFDVSKLEPRINGTEYKYILDTERSNNGRKIYILEDIVDKNQINEHTTVSVYNEYGNKCNEFGAKSEIFKLDGERLYGNILYYTYDNGDPNGMIYFVTDHVKESKVTSAKLVVSANNETVEKLLEQEERQGIFFWHLRYNEDNSDFYNLFGRKNAITKLVYTLDGQEDPIETSDFTIENIVESHGEFYKLILDDEVNYFEVNRIGNSTNIDLSNIDSAWCEFNGNTYSYELNQNLSTENVAVYILEDDAEYDGNTRLYFKVNEQLYEEQYFRVDNGHWIIDNFDFYGELIYYTKNGNPNCAVIFAKESFINPVSDVKVIFDDKELALNYHNYYEVENAYIWEMDWECMDENSPKFNEEYRDIYEEFNMRFDENNFDYIVTYKDENGNTQTISKDDFYIDNMPGTHGYVYCINGSKQNYIISHDFGQSLNYDNDKFISASVRINEKEYFYSFSEELSNEFDKYYFLDEEAISLINEDTKLIICFEDENYENGVYSTEYDWIRANNGIWEIGETIVKGNLIYYTHDGNPNCRYIFVIEFNPSRFEEDRLYAVDVDNVYEEESEKSVLTITNRIFEDVIVDLYSERTIAFYYGKGNVSNDEPIDISKLKFRGENLEAPNSDYYILLDGANNIACIYAEEAGEFYIDYEEKDSSIPFNVALPMLALYSQNNRSPEYLTTIINGKNSGTYYMIWDPMSGLSFDDVKVSYNDKRGQLVYLDDEHCLMDLSTIEDGYVKFVLSDLPYGPFISIELVENEEIIGWPFINLKCARELTPTSVSNVKILFDGEELDLDCYRIDYDNNDFVWEFDWQRYEDDEEYASIVEDYRSRPHTNVEIQYKVGNVTTTIKKENMQVMNYYNRHDLCCTYYNPEKEETNYFVLEQRGIFLDMDYDEFDSAWIQIGEDKAEYILDEKLSDEKNKVYILDLTDEEKMFVGEDADFVVNFITEYGPYEYHDWYGREEYHMINDRECYGRQYYFTKNGETDYSITFCFDIVPTTSLEDIKVKYSINDKNVEIPMKAYAMSEFYRIEFNWDKVEEYGYYYEKEYADKVREFYSEYDYLDFVICYKLNNQEYTIEKKDLETINADLAHFEGKEVVVGDETNIIVVRNIGESIPYTPSEMQSASFTIENTSYEFEYDADLSTKNIAFYKLDTDITDDEIRYLIENDICLDLVFDNDVVIDNMYRVYNDEWIETCRFEGNELYYTQNNNHNCKIVFCVRVNHLHEDEDEFTYDEDYHWHECVEHDGWHIDYEAHDFSEEVMIDPGTYKTPSKWVKKCSICGYEQTEEYAYEKAPYITVTLDEEENIIIDSNDKEFLKNLKTIGFPQQNGGISIVYTFSKEENIAGYSNQFKYDEEKGIIIIDSDIFVSEYTLINGAYDRVEFSFDNQRISCQILEPIVITKGMIPTPEITLQYTKDGLEIFADEDYLIELTSIRKHDRPFGAFIRRADSTGSTIYFGNTEENSNVINLVENHAIIDREDLIINNVPSDTELGISFQAYGYDGNSYKTITLENLILDTPDANDISISLNENEDLVIYSDDLDWIKNIGRSLKTKSGEELSFITLLGSSTITITNNTNEYILDELNNTITIPTSVLVDNSVSNEEYHVKIKAFGYDVYSDDDTVSFTKLCKKAPRDITVNQNTKGDLLIKCTNDSSIGYLDSLIMPTIYYYAGIYEKGGTIDFYQNNRKNASLTNAGYHYEDGTNYYDPIIKISKDKKTLTISNSVLKNEHIGNEENKIVLRAKGYEEISITTNIVKTNKPAPALELLDLYQNGNGDLIISAKEHTIEIKNYLKELANPKNQELSSIWFGMDGIIWNYNMYLSEDGYSVIIDNETLTDLEEYFVNGRELNINFEVNGYSSILDIYLIVDNVNKYYPNDVEIKKLDDNSIEISSNDIDFINSLTSDKAKIEVFDYNDFNYYKKFVNEDFGGVIKNSDNKAIITSDDVYDLFKDYKDDKFFIRIKGYKYISINNYNNLFNFNWINAPETMNINDSATLTIDGRIVTEWNSENENVVSVDSNGIVTANSPGETKVYAKGKEFEIFTKIKVNNPIVTVSMTSAHTDMVVGDEEVLQFKSSIEPNAYNKIQYTSSDDEIAIVDETGKVTFVAPGTVTITGSLYGTETSKKFNVYPIAKTVKFTAKLEETPTYIEPGDILQLVVNGTERQDLFEFTSSNEEIATIDQTGKINVIAKGVVTFTATLKEDLAKRSTTLKVTVIDSVANNLTLDILSNDESKGKEFDVDYVDINNEEIMIVGKSKNKYFDDVTPALSYTSSDTTVAAVDSSGKITIKGPGQVTITGKVTSNPKGLDEIKDEVILRIKDYAPIIESNKITLNKYIDDGIDINVYPVYETEIDNAKLISTGLFSCEVADDSKSINIKVNDQSEDNINSLAAKTYSEILRLTVNGNDYDYKVSVIVQKNLPSVTVKATGTYNTFTNENTLGYDVTVKNGIIDEAREPEFVNDWVMIEGDEIVLQKDAKDKYVTSGVIRFYFEGYNDCGYVDAKVSFKTATTKPTVKLESTSVTLFAPDPEETSKSFNIRLIDGKKNPITSGFVDVYDGNDVITEGLEVDENGSVELIIDDLSIKTLILRYYEDTWTESSYISLKLTIKVNKTLPTAKLSKSSVTLNSKYYLEDSIALTSSSASEQIERIEYECDYVDLSYDGGVLTCEYVGDEGAAGSYKISITPYINHDGIEYDLKPIKLTIKIENKDPKFALKTSTIKLNANYDEEIESIINISNNTYGAELVDLSIDEDAIVDLALSENKDSVSFKLNGNCDDETKLDNYKYNVIPTYSIDGQEIEGAPATVMINLYKKDATATLSVKGNLNPLDSKTSVPITAKLTNIVGDITDIEITNEANELLEVVYGENNSISFKFAEGINLEEVKDQTINVEAKVTVEGTTEIVVKKFTVKVVRKAPTVKLSRSTINVYDKTTNGVIDSSEINLSGVLNAEIDHIEPSANNAYSVELVDNKLIVSLIDGSKIKSGSTTAISIKVFYKGDISPELGKQKVTTVKLSIKDASKTVKR